MQKSLLIASLSLSSFLPMMARSQPAAPSVQPEAQEQEEEKTPLAEAMDALKQGQRSLKRAVKDPAGNKVAILKTVRGMQEAAISAFGLEPAMAADLKGSERELFQVEYRIQMAGFIQSLLKMERAALKDDGTALGELYAELTAAKKSGHKEFKED